jgi:hypothetical protein
MLNGPFPYGDYTSDRIERRLRKGQRPILDEHLVARPQVSPRLRMIINKAISREPLDRYASAREMIDALAAAPFIDWRHTEDLTWEGPVAGHPEMCYRVVAEKKRRFDRWRLSGLKLVTAWRRCVEDQDVSNLEGKGAREFFDQLAKHATSR